MHQLPLYKTLTFKVSLALIFMFLLNGTLLVLWDQSSLLHELETDMQLTYRETAREIAAEIEPIIDETAQVSSFLDSIAEYYPGMELFWVSGSGEILKLSSYVPSTLLRSHVDLEPIRRFLDADTSAYPIEIEIPTAEDLKFVFSAAPIGNPTSSDSYVLVTLVEGGDDPEVSWWDEYGSILVRAAWFSLIIAGLTGLLFWLTLTRRIDRIATAVQNYRAGGQGSILPDIKDDEIGRVSTHVGEMMERIDAMFSDLAAKEKLRTELLATVSHELQTPLTIMQGNLETLLEYRSKMSEAELEKKMQGAYNQIKHMSLLINDMIDVSILDTGQMKITSEPFFMEELIEDVCESFRDLLTREQLEVERNFADSQRAVYADPLRIRQVIRNLMSNAIKFSEPGSRIFLQTEYLPHHMQMSVRDSGPGIPEKDLENIFDRFFRSDHPAAQSVKGTGLGLNICQRILKLHNSELHVLSKTGQGAEFSFRLELFDDDDSI